MSPETLQTEPDYHDAMAALERIFGTARRGTPEGHEFERQAALVEDYERQKHIKEVFLRDLRTDAETQGEWGAIHDDT